MAPTLPAVHRDELDGIPTVWTPAPGPYAGGLSFRVGMADERVQTRGITHLIEHLAHTDLLDELYHENATVEGIVTHFYVCGDPDEVTAHLTRIAAALAELPMRRLDAERRLLQVEEPNTGGIALELLEAAYGLRGPGLMNTRELGAPHVTPDDIAAHLARFFTRGNAVLWFTGHPPPRLGLALPDGPRRPQVAPAPLRLDYPAWVEHESGQTVALGLTGRRELAFVAAMGIAERRAFKRLRSEQGLSYGVGFSQMPLAADVTHCVLSADAHEERDDDVKLVTDGLLDVVRELARTGPTPQELAALADQGRRSYAYPAGLDQDGWLEAHVFDELLGQPLETPEERQARWRALTPDEVAAALSGALPTLVVAGPAGCPTPEGCTPRPPGVHPPVTGELHKIFGPAGWLRSRPRLITAEDGITMILQGEPITVRFDDCAALLTWKNGERLIIGNDGASFPFDHEIFRNSERLTALVDRHIPPALRLPMDGIAPSPFE